MQRIVEIFKRSQDWDLANENWEICFLKSLLRNSLRKSQWGVKRSSDIFRLQIQVSIATLGQIIEIEVEEASPSHMVNAEIVFVSPIGHY